MQPAGQDLGAPFIRHWDINRLSYNGEADRWFDPAWLDAAGHRLQRCALLIARRPAKLLTAVRELSSI